MRQRGCQSGGLYLVYSCDNGAHVCAISAQASVASQFCVLAGFCCTGFTVKKALKKCAVCCRDEELKV